MMSLTFRRSTTWTSELVRTNVICPLRRMRTAFSQVVKHDRPTKSNHPDQHQAAYPLVSGSLDIVPLFIPIFRSNDVHLKPRRLYPSGSSLNGSWSLGCNGSLLTGSSIGESRYARVVLSKPCGSEGGRTSVVKS
jgi:hypothetical protein